MAAGDFNLPDTNTTASSSDVTTLFGVAQGVGDTTLTIKARVPGTMGRGLSLDPQGGTVGGSPAQTGTITQTLQGFYGMDADSLKNLQEQLYAGGFYTDSYYKKGGKTPTFGLPDEDSFAAFKTAVVRSARSQQPLYQVIADAVKSPPAGSGARALLQPPNPDDIRTVVTQAAKKLYGHNADEATIERIISGFTNATTSQQQALTDAQQTGGTVTDAPSATSYADQQLQQAHPLDVATNRGLQLGNLFMQAFGSSAGNQPIPTGASGG